MAAVLREVRRTRSDFNLPYRTKLCQVPSVQVQTKHSLTAGYHNRPEVSPLLESWLQW